MNVALMLAMYQYGVGDLRQEGEELVHRVVCSGCPPGWLSSSSSSGLLDFLDFVEETSCLWVRSNPNTAQRLSLESPPDGSVR